MRLLTNQNLMAMTNKLMVGLAPQEIKITDIRDIERLTPNRRDFLCLSYQEPPSREQYLPTCDHQKYPAPGSTR
ncbi:hypothetical protein KIH07_12850 [Hydrogenophaga taeniospiralis]|jgi:hypothetical protein|uniref:hypothetical protein n=1 Tax=Hydrogenophaga taeniospiralis TaxID=65656 RepID=UPI001CFB1D20|nr:hypothetical protein [Hydrogenophaga taeniospiralis]MCB4364629.1 hypothetical protein [Hydrogenophaga taeniospiralis]